MEGCRRNPPKVLSVGCCDQPTLFHKVIIPAAVGDETTDPPLPGKYRNVLLAYETTENAYLYSSDGIPTLISDKGELKRLEKLIKEEEVARKEEDEKLATAIEDEAKAREDADDALDDAILDETDARIEADEDIWTEIRTIEAASDVVDVVGTYAELEAYDTSKLHDNDLIKVLQDETHGDAITYYRWSTATETFSYVGEQGPYYTQAQTDVLLDGKQNVLTAGDNITISNDVISATDTTYTAGTGLTLTGTEFVVDTTVIAEKSDLPTKTSDLTNDGSDGTSTYVEADDLATVATTGSYTDLTNTPSIPAAQVNSDWNASSGVAEILNKPTLAAVATSGSYNDLTDTPTIPSPYTLPIASANTLGGIKVGQNLSIDANGVLDAQAGGSTYTAGNGISIDQNNEISIDTSVVAELSDLPTKTSELTNDGSDGISTYVEASDLATVATSGSYTDLSNTPTIPTVNDATLTITQNGTSAGTFTANSATNTTIALTDTTYSAFTGTDGTAVGTSGLVPAPATTDAGKFLKADGTWDTAGGGTLYSTTGQNTDGAMTQKATTDMIFVPGYSPEYSTIDSRIRIGYNASSSTKDGIAIGRATSVTQSGSSGVAIGYNAQVETTQGLAIGTGATTTYNGSQGVAIGGSSIADGLYSVALGFGSSTGIQDYVVSVGRKTVNNELYRRIINVADATAAHDAVTKGQLDTVAGTIPSTNNISSGDWSALWQ